MNKQIPITEVSKEASHLQVHSIFSTLQGEGPFSGRKAVFIRLYGCNLQCPNCDTDYTSQSKRMSIDEIIQHFYKLGVKSWEFPLVVITGGEPFNHNLTTLVSTLVTNKIRVQIETNGLRQIPQYIADCATIVCSPKGAVHKDNFRKIDYLKYVIHSHYVSGEDGLPTRALGRTQNVARPPSWFQKRDIYVQPEDTQNAMQNDENRKMVAHICRHFGYTAQVQLHKLLGLD